MSAKLVTGALTALLLFVSGCATIWQSGAVDKERTLAAAGFQMQRADTPERMSLVEALPQRELRPVRYRGEGRFVYADADYCRCIYVGTEAAYDRFQDLALEQRMATVEANAAMDVSMNWDVWGPWQQGAP